MQEHVRLFNMAANSSCWDGVGSGGFDEMERSKVPVGWGIILMEKFCRSFSASALRYIAVSNNDGWRRTISPLRSRQIRISAIDSAHISPRKTVISSNILGYVWSVGNALLYGLPLK